MPRERCHAARSICWFLPSSGMRSHTAPPTDLSSGLGKDRGEREGTTAKRAPRARATRHCSHRVAFDTMASLVSLITCPGCYLTKQPCLFSDLCNLKKSIKRLLL